MFQDGDFIRAGDILADVPNSRASNSTKQKNQKPAQRPTHIKDYAYFELIKVAGVDPKTAQTILGKLASGRDLTAKEREYLNAAGLG